jgi:GTPase SAR1 family protein
VVGMAGSGKTTLMAQLQRSLNLRARSSHSGGVGRAGGVGGGGGGGEGRGVGDGDGADDVDVRNSFSVHRVEKNVVFRRFRYSSTI